MQPNWQLSTRRFSQYWLETRKEKKKRVMLYFGYLLEPIIEIWRTTPFFSQKFFVCVEIIFFRLRKCKFLPLKKPMHWSVPSHVPSRKRMNIRSKSWMDEVYARMVNETYPLVPRMLLVYDSGNALNVHYTSFFHVHFLHTY